MKPPVFLLLCTAVFLLNSCDIIKEQLSVAYTRNVSSGPFDVVIVPGTPYDSAKVSPIYKARLLWAKTLFDKGIAKNIIFSGAATHSAYVEGQTMKMMADSLGIPAEHTFVESRALHSKENIAYGIELAHQLGFRKIAVATDPFQSYYLKKHLSEFKFPIALLPFNIDDMPAYFKMVMPRIDASTARIENFVPLEKREMAMK
jgi:uncharacterized SAM-binding protein YcdF (DUF218 family)